MTNHSQSHPIDVLSPEFTSWLHKEKLLAKRQQAILRTFGLAFLILLAAAVLLHEQSTTGTAEVSTAYTETSLSN